MATGELALADCQADPGDASSAPANGGAGDARPPSLLDRRASPHLHNWITVSGSSSVAAGVQAPATCQTDPGDASRAPANGGAGDCTSTLASGSTCQLTCATGFMVSGSSSCAAGALAATTFSADPCDASSAPAHTRSSGTSWTGPRGGPADLEPQRTSRQNIECNGRGEVLARC